MLYTECLTEMPRCPFKFTLLLVKINWIIALNQGFGQPTIQFIGKMVIVNSENFKNRWCWNKYDSPRLDSNTIYHSIAAIYCVPIIRLNMIHIGSGIVVAKQSALFQTMRATLFMEGLMDQFYLFQSTLFEKVINGRILYNIQLSFVRFKQRWLDQC